MPKGYRLLGQWEMVWRPKSVQGVSDTELAEFEIPLTKDEVVYIYNFCIIRRINDIRELSYSTENHKINSFKITENNMR